MKKMITIMAEWANKKLLTDDVLVPIKKLPQMEQKIQMQDIKKTFELQQMKLDVPQTSKNLVMIQVVILVHELEEMTKKVDVLQCFIKKN